MFISGWMDKQNVLDIYDEIMLYLKRGENSNMSYIMEKHRRHEAKGRNQLHKDKS